MSDAQNPGSLGWGKDMSAVEIQGGGSITGGEGAGAPDGVDFRGRSEAVWPAEDLKAFDRC